MCEYVLTTCSKIRPPKRFAAHRRKCGAIVEIKVELCKEKNKPGEKPCPGRRENTRDGGTAGHCDFCKARDSAGHDSRYGSVSSSSSGYPTSGGSAVSEKSFLGCS